MAFLSKLFKRKPKVQTPEQLEVQRTKDFFDMILPSTIKFYTDHYIVGDSYRCAWAIREYPPSTEEQAILSQLADKNGVTLRMYHRLVESMPDISGLAVWMDGYIGVYIGNGEVIEAQGTNEGVVRTQLKSRPWKKWLMIPDIKYEAEEKPDEVSKTENSNQSGTGSHR